MHGVRLGEREDRISNVVLVKGHQRPLSGAAADPLGGEEACKYGGEARPGWPNARGVDGAQRWVARKAGGSEAAVLA